MTDDAVQRFNRFGGVDGFAYVARIGKEGVEIMAGLRQLRKKIAELHEESLSAPLGKRNGFGRLLATCKWELTEFKKLRR